MVENNPINLVDILGLNPGLSILSPGSPAYIAGLGLAGAGAAAMAADPLEEAINRAIDNFRSGTGGKDPCESAKEAVRRARQGIQNARQTIAEHEAKIANPSAYLRPGYPSQWAINTWTKQIAAQKRGVEIMQRALTVLEEAEKKACFCWYKPWTW